ncbi:hypothetical protein QM306_38140, partial [Burkholderia cenocepacia]|nr:hypothetical protein [Burkholderia cenocepacia]
MRASKQGTVGKTEKTALERHSAGPRFERGPAECRSSAVFSVFPTVPCLEARIYRAACMRRRARPIVTSVDVRILAAR